MLYMNKLMNVFNLLICLDLLIDGTLGRRIEQDIPKDLVVGIGGSCIFVCASLAYIFHYFLSLLLLYSVTFVLFLHPLLV